MKIKYKNVKISDKHHNILKKHCDDNGLKIYKIIEKWIDIHCKVKEQPKDMYGD